MMIACTPRSLLSWNYDLLMDDRQAHTRINWMKEDGEVEVDGVRFQVEKHGTFSGRWTLEHRGVIVAEGQKTNPFTRTFIIKAADYELRVEAESLGARPMIIKDGDATIAKIRPLRFLSRRMIMDLRKGGYDFAVLAFSFWLLSVVWKRHAA